MMAVDIETKEGFRAGTPKVLFEGSYSSSPAPLQPGFGYDVSPDRRWFLLIKLGSEANAPRSTPGGRELVRRTAPPRPHANQVIQFFVVTRCSAKTTYGSRRTTGQLPSVAPISRNAVATFAAETWVLYLGYEDKIEDRA